MNKEIEELVKQTGAKAVFYELTEERKQELVKIAEQVIVFLARRTASPIEAGIVMQLLMETLEETIGAKIAHFISENHAQS